MKEFNLFDIHAHLNDKRFDSDRERVVSEMKELGVAAIVVGTDEDMSRKAVEMADAHENLWAAVGMHPHDNLTEKFSPDFYRGLLKHPKVVAIGECGLDYGKNSAEVTDEEKKRQREIFVEHIKLAKEFDKPLIVHSRNAYEDVRNLMLEHGAGVGAVMHFFAGDIVTARQFLDMGYYISFDGPITFARDYDNVVRSIPTDRIMAETDAPYVAPAPYRGKRNEPKYVEEVVKKMAEIRGETYETVRVSTVQNARTFFRI